MVGGLIRILGLSPVEELLHTVDAHDPLVGGEGLFNCLQFKGLVADVGVANSVVAGRVS